MARRLTTLLAIALVVLALANSASAACVSQIDASTCLVGWTANDNETCLSDVGDLVNGEPGCNEYVYAEGDTSGVCLLKKENCSPGDIVNSDNSPADACPSAVLTLADSLTFECSGTAAKPTPTSPPGATSFVGFCTYQADQCGTIFQPADASNCDDLISIVISSTSTDCSAWNYASSGSGCYMQYLADDSSCSYINTLIDAVNSSNSTDAFEDNGECDSSLLPTSALEFSDPCSLPPTPSADSSSDPSPLGGPPAPKAPGITLFPVGTNRSPPPMGSSKPSPPPSPRSFAPPPGLTITSGALEGARIGVAAVLVLLAALAYTL